MMGYISKNIAKITEPEIMSLATNTNFVTFESKPFDEQGKPITKKYWEVEIEVQLTPELVSQSKIEIKKPKTNKEEEDVLCSIIGTTDEDNQSTSVFYIAKDLAQTAENIKNALLANSWVSANLDIKIPFDFLQDKVINGKRIHLKSKGAGTPYNIEISADQNAYTLTWVNAKSENKDSITGEELSTEIELDIFENTGILMGADDRLFKHNSIYGTPLTSIQKTYQGAPLWFDLNSLMSKKTTYNAPPTTLGWFDTGTVSDYRFVAKVKGKTSYPFYYSKVLYVLNGYGYSLSPVELKPYIFNNRNTEKIKLLTNKPYGKHIKGQKEYLNFLFEDQSRGVALGSAEYTIEVAYKLFKFGGEYITTIYDHKINRKNLGVVNTCVIDLTSILTANTGKVEIVLTRNRAEISEPMKLEIVPECLHRLRSFTFLNRLGGWDSFNADTEIDTESKQTADTYYKTLTPNRKVGDSIKTVHNVELDITYSLETDLLDTATRIWLQELLASSVIFDGDGNYIILESSKLPISSAMDTLSFKYKLTDKYKA